MSMRLHYLLALVGLTSCAASDAEILNHGITAGQEQVVTAGVAQLPQSVTWRLARTASGGITAERVLDVVVPRAYAQGTTVVKGSPVPGAVVCATTKSGLTPFVPCTNTDNNGNATFFFTVDSTKAKRYYSEIRGTVENKPAVFDTAFVTVTTGPMDSLRWMNDLGFQPSATLADSAARDPYGNVIPYRLVSDGHLNVVGDTVGTVAARTVTFTVSHSDSLPGVLEMRDSTDTLIGKVHYVWLRTSPIGGGPVTTAVSLRVRGLKSPVAP